MYSRPRRIPATINQICEAANALIKVVEPNETSKTGQAADAKATFEALETKAGKPDVEALDGRIADLEKNGTGGGSSVDVVAPSPGGKGKAADAKAVYEEIRSLTDDISDLEAADLIFDDKLFDKVDKLISPPNGVVYPDEVQLENGGFYLLGANESSSCDAYLPTPTYFDPQTFIVFCRNSTSVRFIDRLGRAICSNLSGTSYTGGSVNLQSIGFPTKRFVAVTMRKLRSDYGNEIIHLEIV